jgi:hypothetical protein
VDKQGNEPNRLIATMEGPTKTNHSVTAVVVALTVMVFVLDLLTPLGIAIWILYILPLGVTRWSSFRPLTAAGAGACTPLIILGYYLSPPGIEPEISLINRLLGISMLGIAAFFLRVAKA